MMAMSTTKKRRSRSSRRSSRSKRHGNAGVRHLVRTDAMPGRAGMYQYGPKGRNGASIWVSGPIGGTWYATVKFRSQEKDLDARTLDGVLKAAQGWVDAAPELMSRGRACRCAATLASDPLAHAPQCPVSRLP